MSLKGGGPGAELSMSVVVGTEGIVVAMASLLMIGLIWTNQSAD
jgi:hypothetical protein